MHPGLKALLFMLHQPRPALLKGVVLALAVTILGSRPSLGALQEPNQLYEGLQVSRVDLVAQPTLNVEVFRPLVAQKAGTAYSTADIQKTITALQRTGKFTHVRVEVTPEMNGLRVAFIMEPVFYLGTIRFPGAIKVFSYPRLLQAVDYPEQDPYEASRAEQGEPRLTKFFSRQGYFRARVKAATKLDPDRRLANIVYDVTLGPRAKFGAIQISGAPPAAAAKLKGALGSFHAFLHGATVKEGKPYSPGHLQAATKLLQASLGNQNYLANRVSLDPPIYDPETNRASVRWQVTLGLKVQIRVAGAHISKRQMKKLIPMYEENAFDADLVEEGRRNLVSYFQAKGYFDVKVSPQTNREPTQILLVYQMDRGPRHRVAAVDITGNRHFTRRQLAAQMVVQKARFFSHGKFSDDLLDRSVTNLTAFYHNAGYQDVGVHPHVVSHGGNIDVTFQITEGELTRVEALHVEGNKTQTLATLAPKGLNLKAGEPYSQSRFNKDRSHIIARYLELGYPNATLKASLQPGPGDSHRVIVTFLIDEGPHVDVSKVEFLGQVHTQQRMVEQNTSLKAREPLSEAKVLGSESSLYNLGIFDWATVAPRRPITDQKKEDVLVRVHEAKRNSVTYGVGLQYTPVGGSLSSGIIALPGLPTLGLPSSVKILEKNIFSPLGSIEYSRLNMLGRAETASFGAFVSLLDQRGSFNYSDPQFFGQRWSALLSVSAEHTAQNPLFTARLGTASVQLEKVLNQAKTRRLQIRYAYQRTVLSNLLIENFIPPEDESVRSSMVSASFILDTRDKPLDAHRGFYETVDLGISPKVFGSSDNFARFYGQTAYYRQVTPWMVWANDARLGLVDSFAGSHVPISELYFSGGANSLRGFPLNGAGPQVLATICTKPNDPASCTQEITAPSGGHQLFIFNTEGRFPLSMIYKNLGGAVFYDGGNVYSHIGFSHFFSGFSNTIGIGLRYETPVGPIRIDVGQNLNPVPGFKSTNLFITLGQAF